MVNNLRIDETAPWKQRFRVPVVLWTQLARAVPTHGLAASNRSGVYQLYAWDVASGELRQLTDRPEGQLFGFISPQGRFIYYLDDRQGNEIGHFVRVPFQEGAAQDITPELPAYSSFAFGESLAGNLVTLVAALSGEFQIYALDAGPTGALSAPRVLYTTSHFLGGLALGTNGEVVVVHTNEHTGKPQYSLLAIDPTTGQRIAELWDGADSSIEATGFAPAAGDTRLLASTNRSGIERPLIWNPLTGERIDLALDDLEGEVAPLDWSPDARRILLCQFVRAVQRLYVYDLSDETLTPLQHPGGSFDAVYFATQDEIFAHWQDSTHPTHLIALEAQTGRMRRTVLRAGETPPSHSWQSITFPSSVGQVIQGWLGLPAPRGSGPFPTILFTHGGPQGVTTESFDAAAQAWLDHGFAFLTINYRGSTTFGRKFEEVIWGDLGHWEVEDMVAAHAWLVHEGIARPDQIFLSGWSYGGYLTLLGLGKRPDLWAGGMAGVAIADWAVQYEDSADTLKGYQAAIFGGTPAEKPAQYAASSPITYAENVQAPVLIIQGRNDTRTPARPIEMYEAKLKALGKPVEVHWFEAGHLGPFAQVELGVQHQEIMLRFAYRVLGYAQA